jgi:hypothetical protein
VTFCIVWATPLLLALRTVVPGNGSRILVKLENANPTGTLPSRKRQADPQLENIIVLCCRV